MEPIVKELSAANRAALEAHLLALAPEDRRLRFGAPRPDAAVRAYVAGIDFTRDAAFGVFDSELSLAGAAHLARGTGCAEAGISVLPQARRRGFGAALLARCAMHARGWYVQTLYMHCLAENAPMLRLARRQRMRIVITTGEADAQLGLPPPDPGGIAAELIAERLASFDLLLKRQLLAVRTLGRALLPATAS